MILETIEVGSWGVNCYVLAPSENSKAFIVDPGDEEKKINKVLKKYRLTAGAVINTHGHFDHICCDDSFGVPVYVHALDEGLLKDPKKNLSMFFGFPYSVKSTIITVQDNQLIKLEGITLEVIHTPGHTPGGIALLLKEPQEKVILTGDTLFCQGIGRTDLGGDYNVQIKSIREKLFSLPDDIKIYPGHGPSSTIGEEKKNNPFLS